MGNDLVVDMRKKKQKQPKLRACPFCGSQDLRFENGRDIDSIKAWVVVCSNCVALGPVDLSGQTQRMAVQRWNTRVVREEDLPDEFRIMITAKKYFGVYCE